MATMQLSGNLLLGTLVTISLAWNAIAWPDEPKECLRQACLGLAKESLSVSKICSRTGYFYVDKCEYNKEVCHIPELEIGTKGPGCGFYDGPEGYMCPNVHHCGNYKNQVCGTNGITYHNRCVLTMVNDCSPFSIRSAHEGPCTGDEATRRRNLDKTCEKEEPDWFSRTRHNDPLYK